jgi:hypothetical protein
LAFRARDARASVHDRSFGAVGWPGASARVGLASGSAWSRRPRVWAARQSFPREDRVCSRLPPLPRGIGHEEPPVAPARLAACSFSGIDPKTSDRHYPDMGLGDATSRISPCPRPERLNAAAAPLMRDGPEDGSIDTGPAAAHEARPTTNPALRQPRPLERMFMAWARGLAPTNRMVARFRR